MAKENKKEGKDKSAKRGRPSSTEKDSTAKNDVLEKNDVKKSENPIQKKLSEVEQLNLDIYGNEHLKDFVPFPKSEQKTQIVTLIKEFNIEVGRLPQNILDLINDFATDFTTFTNNPMMFNLIPEIQKKENIATVELTNWINSRMDKFTLLRQKTNGGISFVTNENEQANKTVVDSNSVNDILKNMPQSTKNTNQNNNQNQQHQQGVNFNPIRQADAGTYQHHIHSNPAQPNNITPQNPLGNHPMGMVENKNIHHEMLSKSNHFMDVHKQQNLQYNPPPTPKVEPKEYLKNYLDSIMSSVTGYYKFIHYGFIPVDDLKHILSTCDKAFTYEIVQDKNNNEWFYLTISNVTDKVTSDKFKVQ